MLALSESIPAEVHFNAPPEEQPGPYIVVEPLGASVNAKTTQVRVSLVDASGDVSEVRTLLGTARTSTRGSASATRSASSPRASRADRVDITGDERRHHQ